MRPPATVALRQMENLTFYEKYAFPPKLVFFMESNHAQGGRLTQRGSVCSHGAGQERVAVKTVFIPRWQPESICAGGDGGGG